MVDGLGFGLQGKQGPVHGSTTGKGTAGKAVAKFLHTLYELDVVEEEIILAWDEKDGCGDQDTVKVAVKPIIEFLQEEDDDDDDDESDDEE